MNSVNRQYDVVVVGGGHNGLVAASYLSRAGLSVLVLERLDHPDLTSTSRYPALVAPMPERLSADLGLDLPLVPRPLASYALTLRDGEPRGLLLQRAESFRELTGGDEEYDAWKRFQADVGDLARAVAPTLLQPLPSERVVRDQVDPAVWADVVAHPLGETVESRFSDDTVRGVAASDALTGSFASLGDRSLTQNRSFLYHLVGDETGGGQVPLGGMSALTDALTRTAVASGTEVLTSAGVSAIEAGDDGAEVTWHDGTGSHTVAARFVLSNVAPWVLDILLGHGEDPTTKPEGAQTTIDLVLDRLPRFASGVDPEVAFAGALHVGHGYAELAAAYDDAVAGRVPSVLPGRVVMDSTNGTYTLTYAGTHTPASLFARDPEGTRQRVVARALATLDQHLVEPVASCLATDADGRPRVEVTIPQDLERDLALPGGHLFHGDLEWPWAPHRSRLETPAQQWGVQTDVASVLVCGSGSRRGGALAGLGGHSAAHAVLASR